MNFDAISPIGDELDEPEEVESPKRQARPVRAMPAEPIPHYLNADFLDALAYERALSTARGLASGLNGDVGGLGGVSGPGGPSEPATAVQQPAEAALCALERAVETARDLAL